jgi:hypothetical protein
MRVVPSVKVVTGKYFIIATIINSEKLLKYKSIVKESY